MKEFFEKIFNLIVLPICWKDNKGNYIGCNHVFADLLNLKSSMEIRGRQDSDFFEKYFALQNEKQDKEVLTFKQFTDLEVEVNFLNKKKAFYLIKKMILPFENAMDILLSVWINIDKYKKKEIFLSNELDQLDQIVSLMPGHAYWLDNSNVYLGCNEEQAKHLGLSSRKEIIGKRNSDLSWKKQAHLLDSLNSKVMKTGKPYVREEDALVGTEIRTYLSKKVPFIGKDGEVKGILGVSMDVTERKKMELALAKAKDEAEERAREKSEFLTNMSHDLRTPLIGMIGLSEYLYDQVKQAKHKDLAYQMLELSRNLLEVSNSLIEAAQVESGKLPVAKEIFSIKKLIGSIKALLKPTASAKNLQFELFYTPTFSDYWLGDEKRIRRIMINLISNAIKFTKHGFIRVHVDIIPDESNQYTLLLKIRDSGPGIPKKKQQLIFKRFTRLGSKKGIDNKGFGLGLNIVDQFIHDLKGKIEIESEVGQGSTFICFIPITAPDISSVSEKINELKIQETPGTYKITQEKKGLLPKLKVLVIEDNKIARFSVKHLFEKNGFKIDATESAKKGVLLYEKNRYDLILTDLGLQDKDGYWISKMIRQHEKNHPRKIPAIILGLSAHLSANEEKKCFQSGMNECLLKPLTQQKITHILKEYFSYHALTKSHKKNQYTDEPLALKVIDLEQSAREYYSGDMEAAKRMLNLLLKMMPTEEERMQAAVDNKDWDLLYRLVHNFYGGCVACAAPRLTKSLSILKDALRKKEGNQNYEGLYQDIVQEMKILREAYKSK